MKNLSPISECLCPPPQIHAENLTPKVVELEGGTLERCSGHESRAHMSGISALFKEASESSLVPPTM